MPHSVALSSPPAEDIDLPDAPSFQIAEEVENVDQISSPKKNDAVEVDKVNLEDMFATDDEDDEYGSSNPAGQSHQTIQGSSPSPV